MINYVSLYIFILSINLTLVKIFSFAVNNYYLFGITLIATILIFLYKEFKKAKISLGLIFLFGSFVLLKFIPRIYLMNTKMFGIDFEFYYKLFKYNYFIRFYDWAINFVKLNIIGDEFSFIITFIFLVSLGIGFTIRKIFEFKYDKYLLLSGVLLFTAYYNLENIIYYLNLYFFGYFIYYFSNINLKRKMRRFFIGDFLVILSIILIVNVVSGIFPLETVNRQLDPYVPDLFEADEGYKKKVNSLFSFRNTIYNPYKNRLGGPVVEDDEIVFRIKSNFDKVYLRGRVSNIYTGNNWYNDKTIFRNVINENITDSSYKDRIILNILRENEISSNIFAPINLIETELDEEKLFSNIDGIYFYKGDLPNEYRLIGVNRSLSIDDKDRYLEVSESIEDEVFELNETIVKNAESDEEVINKIIEYLDENYRYTLKPSFIGAEEDFVSDFLLREKQGYCTYFASSLAILGRINNIPTRYVEGYVASTDVDEDGYFVVRKNDAHAWVEVFIEGKGWQTFESTPNREVGLREFVVDEQQGEEEQPDVNLEDYDFEREITDFEESIGGKESQERDHDLFKYIIIIFIIIFIVVISILYYIINKEMKDKDQIYFTLQLINRIDPRINFAYPNKKDFTLIDGIDDDIIKIINKFLYSDRYLVIEEREKLDDFIKLIKEIYINKFGKINYYYQRLKGDF